MPVKKKNVTRKPSDHPSEGHQFPMPKVLRKPSDYPRPGYDRFRLDVVFLEGYLPPMPDPKNGNIFAPDKEATSQHRIYADRADTLMVHMEACIPAEAWEHIQLDRELKVPIHGHTHDHWIAMAYHLNLVSFVLSEYVDAHHPLLKIATSPNFKAFKKAVDALPEVPAPGLYAKTPQ